ncbi:DNA gyrase/topoisomerase IV subunit A [Salibacteraceae bacterium]|nr:DNA gyrase/topoisomerase IV subunit A [Salibacteraceae bacterium]MDC1205024.1 DNA gyrase/topoisomerase IV subunit A [Salibacteraceae bacterium]
MSEDSTDNIDEKDEEFEALDSDTDIGDGGEDDVIRVSGMYKEWFLDYASYVILERAVPHVNDGFKPVQRRILHSLKELDDGRYNKVANVVGNTMKYHPHGDASIADALVALGQKELLIDTQGNWGNTLTGDRAAAPRYIEARLSKFALEVVFNPKTTNWQLSYDGRNKEPITLPVKFPMLLAHGVEGIAVGLSCKILPHNFIEIIEASINFLQGRKTKIYPDFLGGGMVDVSNYNDGLRGGKIRVRAKISAIDKKTLLISEVPFATTTTSVIESILKANDKGKIKIKKIEDNTSEFCEIQVLLATGVSPDKTIDALYAFTDCEVSISPNAVIIEDDKPRFVTISEILQLNVDHSKDLLKLELEIRKGELEEQWHFSSLEKIFIENKIYIDFDGKTYDEAIEVTHKLLKPHIKHLKRAITDEDVKRLLEIRMRRITKHDADKADNFITQLEEELAQVQHHLDNLVEYAIDYYKGLKKRYSEGKERKTEIKSFETIERSKVAVANVKLYVNMAEGFAGTSLKKSDSEFVCDCSDIDDIIVIRKSGEMMVSRISDKAFFGKDIAYINVWKKGDNRTIYNLIYFDGKSKYSMVKRFAVTSITRDKEYHVSAGAPGSKIHYMSVNRNGEAEVVKVLLRQKPKIKNLKFDFDFTEIGIKGRSAKGNILTKNLVHKIEIKEEGISTLGARKIWWDDTVSRLNADERGKLVGEFKAEDKIVAIMDDGSYRMYPQSLNTHFEENMIIIEKFDPEQVFSLVYYDGEKGQHFVKRFVLESSEKAQSLLTEHEDSRLEVISKHTFPVVKVEFDKRSSKNKDPETVELHDFIAVKGYKALGNRLSADKVRQVTELEPLTEPDKPEPEEQNTEVIEAEVVTEKKPIAVQAAEEEPADEEMPIKESKIEQKAAPVKKEKPVAKESVKEKPAKKETPSAMPIKEVGTSKAKSIKKEESKKPNANSKQKGDDDDDEVPPEGPVQITLEL